MYAEETDLSPIARLVCDRERFTFGALVGAGAFKQTFRATTAEGEPRALKVYDPRRMSPRAEREVQAITRCNHPNIARFFSFAGIDVNGETFAYSVEEFLSGGTLTQAMSSPMPAAKVRELAAPLIDAVAHIERLDLVHRDIKPDNIMFRRVDGAPVVVDFGLVRDLSRSSLTRDWLAQGPGTPFFASPEQLNNEKHLIDWRSDQFALGLVLGLCLTGRHPWAQQGFTDGQTVEAIAERAGPSPEFILAALSAGLSVLVTMVAPWPVERIRTPDELAAAWAAGRG